VSRLSLAHLSTEFCKRVFWMRSIPAATDRAPGPNMPPFGRRHQPPQMPAPRSPISRGYYIAAFIPAPLADVVRFSRITYEDVARCIV